MIVAMVSRSRRGQHTEKPFESATLNLRQLREYRLGPAGDLASAVVQSAVESAAYSQLQSEMANVVEEAKRRAASDVTRVTKALEEAGLR